MERVCGNCIKWKHNAGAMGECRAIPPAPVVFKGAPVKQYTTVWPPMGKDDFCYDGFKAALRTT